MPSFSYKFATLSEDSQTDYWASEGRYIAQRYEDEYAIGIYDVDVFFVETWYDPIDNELSWLRS